jgi:hypothetical protein
MMRVSVSRGMAERTATISSLRPFILDIVFSGLKTLKVLRL